MSVRSTIQRLEKATNIKDKKYEIKVRIGIIKSPTETTWFEDREDLRRYKAEQKAQKQEPRNHTSQNGRDHA